jgi:hypothetical protein
MNQDFAGCLVRLTFDEVSQSWVIRDFGTMRPHGTVDTISVKHAILGQPNEIIGTVTKSERFPNGFDCANVDFDGRLVWKSRDSRNNTPWVESDLVHIRGKSINAGSCKLIDIYDV